MTTGFQHLLDELQQTGADLTDGQLLAHFIATRDEPSFAALVRRYGPMVLGVCRRVLRDAHDAEDAFQAAFLVLAQKAASVVKRESLSCWLYQVAYHAALEARAGLARRRALERPMNGVPHPETAPADIQDWRPLLDRELNGLPEKYRAAVILCNLEGRTRKEAAQQLGIPEGTLSSRLAAAHKLLAKRLAGSGLPMTAGVLASAISGGVAAAQVPAPLVCSTATAAVFAAANQLTAVSASAVLLMRGVLKAMLLKKLKVASGVMAVMMALGAMGLGYATSGGPGAGGPYRQPSRSTNELDALRKENELLKLNLEVVLEKVRAQEAELRAFRGRMAPRTDLAPPPGMGSGGGPMAPGGGMGLPPGGAGAAPPSGGMGSPGGARFVPPGSGAGGSGGFPPGAGGGGSGGGSPSETGTSGGNKEVLRLIEKALNELRQTSDPKRNQRAAEELDKALKQLKEQLR